MLRTCLTQSMAADQYNADPCRLMIRIWPRTDTLWIHTSVTRIHRNHWNIQRGAAIQTIHSHRPIQCGSMWQYSEQNSIATWDKVCNMLVITRSQGLHPESISTNLAMRINVLDVEHGRNRLITGHWCIPLTSARETTNNDNDPQGTPVQSNEYEYMIWCRILNGIFRSAANDVNWLSKAKRPAIKACRLQGTERFLNLFPGWYVGVDRKRSVEGGPWWFPHQRHETKYRDWCSRTELVRNWHNMIGMTLGRLPLNI